MGIGKKTNSSRMFPGKGGSKSRPDGYDRRVKDAVGRAEAWAALSTKDKLRILATRPGKCAKQVARIKKAA